MLSVMAMTDSIMNLRIAQHTEQYTARSNIIIEGVDGFTHPPFNDDVDG